MDTGAILSVLIIRKKARKKMFIPLVQDHSVSSSYLMLVNRIEVLAVEEIFIGDKKFWV